MAKKKKKSLKYKVRYFLAFLVFSGITAVLGYNLVTNVMAINKMKVQKKELSSQLSKLEDEKKVLESDIMKLEDPDYIAKYVREKYFYSKDGELILRIEE